MEIPSSPLLETEAILGKRKISIISDKKQSRDVSSDMKKVHFQKVH